jgi:hypothetical protein
MSPVSSIWKFDRLAMSEAITLLRALAEEEAGLRSSPSGSSGLSHCVCRDHEHKSSHNSESLGVRPSRKYKATSVKGEEAQVGFLKCYGHCGFEGRVSEYLLQVGPAGAAEAFWSDARVNASLLALSKAEGLSLGWHAWKEEHGVEAKGRSAAARPAVFAPHTRTLQEIRDAFARDFPAEPEEDVVEQVCSRRGWNPDTVRQLAQEGLLGLTRDQSFPDDVRLGFAYYGLAETSGHPARLIKYRLLMRKRDQAPASVSTIINPASDPLYLADFSSPGKLQSAGTIAFVEGEPDSASWRHLRPRDALICIGTKTCYQQIARVTPMLHLEGKTVVYCLDRDESSTGHWLGKGVLTHHLAALEAIFAGNPQAVGLWMCPKKTGVPCKDPNDFLLHQRGEPLAYARPLRCAGDFVEAMTWHGLPVTKEEIQKSLGPSSREAVSATAMSAPEPGRSSPRSASRRDQACLPARA